MRSLTAVLNTQDIPRLALPNYFVELRHASLWGCVVGAVEGSMASVVISKTFGGSALLTTITWALPILVNVFNVGWSTVIRGRPRKPLYFMMVACSVAVIGSIGLTSADWKPWGGWIFAGQIGLTHLFLSGLITLRTTVWRGNYPATHRARIAGRLQTVQFLIAICTSALLALLFNRGPELYRLVYPAIALIGLLALVPLRRLRMRGERTELSRYRAHLAENGRSAPDVGLWVGLKEAGRILRRDPLYARYMLAQFLLGGANFFTDPILVTILTKQLALDYFSSQALLYVIPSISLMLSIHFWASLFDSNGVLRLRVYNSACWVASYACLAMAAALLTIHAQLMLIPALAVLAVGRVLNGLGRGGGAIAWNLGHLHFAGEHDTEMYMGIHVGLTGLRGLLMPLVGLLAYEYCGWVALVIGLAFAVVAHGMFRRMAMPDSTGPEAAPRGAQSVPLRPAPAPQRAH